MASGLWRAHLSGKGLNVLMGESSVMMLQWTSVFSTAGALFVGLVAGAHLRGV